MTKHFQTIVRLALSIVLASLVFSSCGGPKFADSAQIKAYIFMESIDDAYKNSIADDFYTLLSNGKIKDVCVPKETMFLESGQDGYEVNPWLEYFKIIFCSRHKQMPWKLDEDEELQLLCDAWNGDYKYYYGDSNYRYLDAIAWASSFPHSIDNSIEEHEKKRSNYWDRGWETNVEEENQYINGYKLVKTLRNNMTDFSANGLLYSNAYIQYIKSIAEKKVDIYDCQYSEAYSTKSVDAYYVIYTIDKDFYVLLRLSEEKKSQRFEIEQIMRGEQLIEIERKLKSLTGE